MGTNGNMGAILQHLCKSWLDAEHVTSHYLNQHGEFAYIYIYVCVCECVYVFQYIEHTGMIIHINYSAYLMLSINLLCLIVGPE